MVPIYLILHKDFSQRLSFASLQGTHHMEEKSEFMNLRYFMPLRFCFWMPKLVSSIVKLLYLWIFCLDHYSKVFINFYAWFSSCCSMFLFRKPSLANEYYAIEIEHEKVSCLGVVVFALKSLILTIYSTPWLMIVLKVLFKWVVLIESCLEVIEIHAKNLFC